MMVIDENDQTDANDNETAIVTNAVRLIANVNPVLNAQSDASVTAHKCANRCGNAMKLVNGVRRKAPKVSAAASVVRIDDKANAEQTAGLNVAMIAAQNAEPTDATTAVRKDELIVGTTDALTVERTAGMTVAQIAGPTGVMTVAPTADLIAEMLTVMVAVISVGPTAAMIAVTPTATDAAISVVQIVGMIAAATTGARISAMATTGRRAATQAVTMVTVMVRGEGMDISAHFTISSTTTGATARSGGSMRASGMISILPAISMIAMSFRKPSAVAVAATRK